MITVILGLSTAMYPGQGPKYKHTHTHAHHPKTTDKSERDAE